MLVFIGWSGERSKVVAEVLRDWLPVVVRASPPIDIWLSSADIDAGQEWRRELATARQRTQFGIICLTRENRDQPWLHYECGALSQLLDEAHLVPYLIDLEPGDIVGPLGLYQAVKADQEGTARLVRDVNAAMGANRSPENIVERVFRGLWPEMEATLEAVAAMDDQGAPAPALEELMREVLQLTRGIARRHAAPPPPPVPPARITEEREDPRQALYHDPVDDTAITPADHPDDDQPLASKTLGNLYLEQGHLERSLQEFEVYQTSHPDDGEAAEKVALIRSRLGMATAAAASPEGAGEPDDADAGG